MATPKKPKVEHWPKECCGACKYSHLVEKELNCFGAPPATLIDPTTSDLYYVESVVVDEHRFPCHLFKLRENS